MVCQRSDAERFSRLAAGDAEIVAGPSAISHRPARLAWEQTGLPLVAQQVGADLIHSPYYTMPLHAPVPVVVTLHDVTFFSEPELHSAVRTGFYRSATRTAVRRAARVVVPSQATRDELVRLLDADPARIDVALHGVDLATFHPPSDAECHRVSDRLGLHGRPYVAFLGVLERRKNVPDLVRGWVRAVDGLDEPPALVLAGSSGWDDGVDQAVAEVPSHLKVVRPGFLRPADLPGPARRRDGRRLPEQGRGLRPAGPRGDGLRRRGAHRPAAVAARGRRRRGRLHRARRRQHRDVAARPDRRRGPAPRGCRGPGRSGPRSSPGRPPRSAHLETYRRAAAGVPV